MSRIIKIVIAFCLVLGISIFVYSYFKKKEIQKEESANIILEKIEEVNKLILIEGTFAEVYTYKQVENVFFDLIPIEKKVIVLVKAKASVGFDMKLLEYKIDKENQTLTILSVPKAEIIIEPTLEYYDVQQNQLAPLSAKDLTEINARAVEIIREHVEVSTLPKMAEDRLAEVLGGIIFTTEQEGWKVINLK